MRTGVGDAVFGGDGLVAVGDVDCATSKPQGVGVSEIDDAGGDADCVTIVNAGVAFAADAGDAAVGGGVVGVAAGAGVGVGGGVGGDDLGTQNQASGD